MKIAIHQDEKMFKHASVWVPECKSYCEEKGIECDIISCYDSDIINKLRGYDAVLWTMQNYVKADLMEARSILNSAKKMGLKSSPGLTDLLMGFESQQMSSFKTDILDNWYVIPSGDLPPNPSELLGSRRMESILNLMTEKFDYIIVDLPPVNIVSDTLAISNLITGMLVVIREDYTEKKELETLRLPTLFTIQVLTFQ